MLCGVTSAAIAQPRCRSAESAPVDSSRWGTIQGGPVASVSSQIVEPNLMWRIRE